MDQILVLDVYLPRTRKGLCSFAAVSGWRGLLASSLLSGAIVTETIFSWPGLGRLTVSAISNRDYALVQGCLLSIGLTYVLVNLLTDVVNRWVNPRMR